MFTGHEEMRKWLLEIIEKFHEKGAVSPGKAMTAEELGLPRAKACLSRNLN
jgi:hypothetical protein